MGLRSAERDGGSADGQDAGAGIGQLWGGGLCGAVPAGSADDAAGEPAEQQRQGVEGDAARRGGGPMDGRTGGGDPVPFGSAGQGAARVHAEVRRGHAQRALSGSRLRRVRGSRGEADGASGADCRDEDSRSAEADAAGRVEAGAGARGRNAGAVADAGTERARGDREPGGGGRPDGQGSIRRRVGGDLRCTGRRRREGRDRNDAGGAATGEAGDGGSGVGGVSAGAAGGQSRSGWRRAYEGAQRLPSRLGRW